MKPMKFIGYKPTLAQLKKRAEKSGIAIRKYERGEDSYVLADMTTGAVVATYPMTQAEILLWLADLEAKKDLEDTDVPF